MSIAGKVALVTGSTSGIGRAAAVKLAEQGATVVVSGRDETRGQAVVEEIASSGGQALFLRAELTGAASAADLARRAVEAAGRVDILVNNVGIATFGPTAAVTEREFDALFATNVKVPLFLVQALAPAMAERGDGAIVNVITMSAFRGLPYQSTYGATKAALDLLTKSWAAEFGPSGVRVNAVSPGPTRTPSTAPMGDGLDQLAAAAPAGRVADPGEIADAIVFLAGDRASFVHGATLMVDGGRLAI